MFEKRKTILREQENPEQSKEQIQLEKIKTFLLKKTYKFDASRYYPDAEAETQLQDVYIHSIDDSTIVVIALADNGLYDSQLRTIEEKIETLLTHISYKAHVKVFNTDHEFEGIKNVFQNGNFKLELSVEDISYYVDVGRDYRDDIIEKYMTGEYYDDYFESDSWSYFVDHLNENNNKAIWAWVRKTLTPEVLADHDIDSFDDMSLEEVIDEFPDELEKAKDIMNWSISDGERDDWANYVVKAIISALEFYGTVTNKWDEGVTIEGNVHAFIKPNDLLDYAYRCDGDIKCIITEGKDDAFDRPKLNIDGRYQPDCDYKVFNDFLHDRLYELDED
jgi:hypothetical protein